MEIKNHNTSIARIENDFIYNAQYLLNAREQKIMLFLISNINPNEKDFNTQIIPIKDLQDIIMTKRSGSFYDEMLEFTERIMSKHIKFRTDVKMKGKKMSGFINWFNSIIPVYNDDGDICLKFKFSEDLKPYLLELQEYAQIDYLETLPLKSGFSIRMYQVFRAHRDRMAKHQKRSKLKYDLGELKSLLGIADKYDDWRNFNRYVIKVLDTEINELTRIKLEINLLRKGRSVVAIEFEFWDKSGKSSRDMDDLGLETYSFSQLRAFDWLVAYGVVDGIAIQMINQVLASELIGFEDWYFEECIKIVKAKSNVLIEAALPGVLVNWFLKLKVFEQGDHFAKLMETLSARKKKLEKENPSAWENRLAARGMTAEAFREMVKG